MNQINKVVLAPMEGVADALMRDLLTTINHYDYCVAEFVRVVNRVVPTHTFYKICPELKNNSKTPSGTPVRVQLLGQHPEMMARNAVKAIELGSFGIDINFGCPAKTVNKSKGGAVLLKEPESMFKIISSVRQAVPQEHTVSAKIRLGFDDISLFDEIVDAVNSAGAQALTIHARTKRDGYRPPAYWQHIGPVSDKYDMEIFANGEIWNMADAKTCIKQAKTPNIMLGRGALAMPNLANVVKGDELPYTWQQTLSTLILWAEKELEGGKSHYFSSRLKQWLRYLKLTYPEAEDFFNLIKRETSKENIVSTLHSLSID